MNAKDVTDSWQVSGLWPTSLIAETDIETTRCFARAFCQAGGITRETLVKADLGLVLGAHPTSMHRDALAKMTRFLTDLLDIGEVE